MRALVWGALGLLMLVLVVALAPTVLAPLLSSRLSARAGHDVHVGWISWNPLRASVELHDVTLAPAAGEPAIVTIAGLQINVALRRWLGGEHVLESVVVDRPWVGLQRTASGDFNVAALFQPTAPPPAEAPAAEPRAGEEHSLRVAIFRVIHGSVRFRDETTAPALETSLYLDDVAAYDVALTDSGRAEIRLRAASRLDTAPLTLDLTYTASAGDSDLEAHLAATGASLSRTLLYVPVGWQKVAGTLDAELTYQRRIRAGTLRTHTIAAQARLRDVAIGEPWAPEPSLRAARARLGQIAVDLIRRRTEIGAVEVEAFDAAIVRDDGGLHVPLANSGGAPNSQWQTSLRTVTLGRGEIVLRGVIPNTDPEIRVPVTRGTITFPRDHLAFAISGAFAGGTVDVKGRVAESTRITFVPRNVALAELATRLRSPVGFSAGRVDGEIVAHVVDGPVRYAGTVTIRDAKSIAPDPARPEDVFAWQALTLTLADATFVPLDLHLSRVALAWPYLMVHRASSGVYPASLLRPAARAGAESTPVRERPAGDARSWLRVDSGRIEGGRIELYDTTLAPAFGMDLANLAGAFADLRATPWSASRVQLTGSGDELSPFEVDATLSGNDAAIGLTLDRLRLAPLSRYVEPALNYAITAGVTHLQSTTKVHKGELDAQNDLVMSRLALKRTGADLVAAEIGMSLPLALALMKDLRGDIHLAVPVQGNIAASEYRLGSLAGKALRDGLIGAVSTPLRLFGSIFTREEEESFDLEPVPFPPGDAALGADGGARIAQVGRLLGRHPELRAVLIPAPAAADATRFRDEAMIAQLEAGERTPITDALLAFLRARQAGASPTPLPPEVGAALRALEAQPLVSLDRLSELAARRTAVVGDSLMKTHGIESGRITAEVWSPTAELPEGVPGVDVQLHGN